MKQLIERIIREGVGFRGLQELLARGRGHGFGRSFVGGDRERQEISALFE